VGSSPFIVTLKLNVLISLGSRSKVGRVMSLRDRFINVAPLSITYINGRKIYVYLTDECVMAKRVTHGYAGIRFLRNVQNNPEDMKFQK
jgi:hypothetical protein